jgi:hypothetical protein
MMRLQLKICLFTMAAGAMSPQIYGEEHNTADSRFHMHDHSEEREFETHSAHQHGSALASLSLDSNILQLDLQIPANDLFGFEHSPASHEQRKTIEAALNHLAQATSVLELAPACSMVSQSVETHYLRDAASSDLSHSEVRSIYLWDCGGIPPKTASFSLFSTFPEIKKITIQFISNETQQLETLTPDSAVFNFPR